MTAIDNQIDLILFQSRLEQQRFNSRYSPGKGGFWLVTPTGLNARLGRGASGMPHFRGKFTGPGVFVVCQPEDPGSVALLLDTGAAINVTGALLRIRLKALLGVGISARAVEGGVSASLGQGTPFIDLVEITDAPLVELELFGTRAVNFTVAAIANACAGPIKWPLKPGAYMAPVQVNLVKSTGPASAAPSPGKALPRGGAGARSPRGPGKAKERRPCRFPLLGSHAAVAGRLGFTNCGVLSRSHTETPANYEYLNESARLYAVTRRKIMKLKDEDSHALSALRNMGGCWYMDWTRKFDGGPSKNKYGLVFVESRT